jgi:RND family efflux transporter MFP subunit
VNRFTLQHAAAGLAVALMLGLLTAPQPALADAFDCLIEPNQTVEVRSPVEGLIRAVYVKRGDRVSAGQALVQLESAPEQSAAEMARFRSQMKGRIESARNRLQYANKKIARVQALQKDHFSTDDALDQAEAEKLIAESELADATENRELAAREHQHALDVLNQRTLRSPFNGVVVDRMLNPGDLAESGAGRKGILKLAQVEPLRVEAVLPPQAFRKVAVGGKATVTPEVVGGRYPATVAVVDSVLDSASGTFGVRLELPNPKGVLPAGVRCSVEFQGLTGVSAKPAKR